MPYTLLPDLWPEIEMENIVTPEAILRFQAGQLRTKTNGLIEAEVRTHRTGTVSHELVLIAPALDRYECVIASFHHGVTLVYPVSIEHQSMRARKCHSQGELLDAVSELLRSENVKAVISSLITQSVSRVN